MFEIKALLFILAEILILTFALKMILKEIASRAVRICRTFCKKSQNFLILHAGDIDHRWYSAVDISFARIRSAANGLLMTIIPRLHNCLLSDLLHEPFVGDRTRKIHWCANRSFALAVKRDHRSAVRFHQICAQRVLITRQQTNGLRHIAQWAFDIPYLRH